MSEAKRSASRSLSRRAQWQSVLAARPRSSFCSRTPRLLASRKKREPERTRNPDERQRNPGRAFKLPTRSRISRSLSSGRPLRAGPVGSSGLQNASGYKEGRRNAGRCVSPTSAPLTFILPRLRGRTEEGARRASGGTRSPVGVPPRLLLRRTNATAQLQLRASWDAAATGALPAFSLSQSSELLADRS